MRCRSKLFAIHALLLAIASGSPALLQAAEKYELRANPRIGSLTRIVARLEVGGELQVRGDSKAEPLKMSVVADMAYEERLLEHQAESRRSLRYYEEARAVIKVAQSGVKPTLRDDRRLIGVEHSGETVTLFAPQGPLTQDELDLIELPGNTLLIDGLLPEKPVIRGSRWKPTDNAWAALLCLDSVSTADIECVLSDVTSRVAKVEFSGLVDGAVDGVATTIELKGRYQFDRRTKSIASVAMAIKEKRSIGPDTPGLDVTARLQVSISPLQTSGNLNDQVVQDLPLTVEAAGTNLCYESTAGKYRLAIGRDWQITEERPQLAVMRLIARGDLIAQCNIAHSQVQPEKRQTLQKFQAGIQKALGDGFQQFVQASERATPDGCIAYRVTATGEVSGLPIEWRYHFLANEQGQQIVLAFTLERTLAEQFGTADEAVVKTIEFVTPPETAATLTPARN